MKPDVILFLRSVKGQLPVRALVRFATGLLETCHHQGDHATDCQPDHTRKPGIREPVHEAATAADCLDEVGRHVQAVDDDPAANPDHCCRAEHRQEAQQPWHGLDQPAPQSAQG